MNITTLIALTLATGLVVDSMARGRRLRSLRNVRNTMMFAAGPVAESLDYLSAIERIFNEECQS